MKLIETDLQGVMIVEHDKLEDDRGYFIKTFNKEIYNSFQLRSSFEEIFFSKSQKNVIRGMHFQKPPYAQVKLVFVICGEILDVVLDLRKQSSTYGKYIQISLSSSDNKSIYIDEGFAHGYISKKDDTIVSYLQSKGYNKNMDSGLNYNSFGMDWRITNPIVSGKDKYLIPFNEFKSPF